VAGRLSGFRTIRVRALWLVWLAAVVQAAQYYAPVLRDAVESIVPMLAIVLALVLVWLAVNLPRWPVAIRVAGVVIALGALLNADFHAGGSGQGSGVFVLQGSVAPPGDGGGGGEVCLA
jgi:hypothetical protein